MQTSADLWGHIHLLDPKHSLSYGGFPDTLLAIWWQKFFIWAKSTGAFQDTGYTSFNEAPVIPALPEHLQNPAEEQYPQARRQTHKLGPVMSWQCTLHPGDIQCL